MSAQRALAEAVLQSATMLTGMLEGFDEGSRTRQAPGLPNHVVWTLGHCALTAHRAAERLDGGALPETDFASPHGGSDAERFDPETVCFGSTPDADPKRAPSLARARLIFEAACERLVRTVSGASDEALAATGLWGRRDIANGLLVSRMCFHHGVHAGQILDLRRALGMPPLIALPRPAPDRGPAT